MSYSFHEFSGIRGPRLELQRVSKDDLPRLAEVLLSPDTWFCAVRKIDTPEKFYADFSKHLEKQERGETLAIMALYEGAPVAMSLYQWPTENFRRLEIGFTWISEKWQHTFVNSELKLLMLDYAFDVIGCARVEFSVGPQNAKSNAAMKRLGATFEGMLRKWRYVPGVDDGDRNIYSILNDEWPVLRERVVARMR